jgi:hypothetical protein
LTFRTAATLVAIAFGGLRLPLASAAAPTSGNVQGVVIPPPRVDPPPARHLGFLPRIDNPIVELRQYDPLPECFVFLEGGPGGEAAPAKASVVWQLESHSFNPPLLPVVAGANVEIANVGRETHLLSSPGHEDLLTKDPIGPGSSRTIGAPAAGQAVKIVSRAAPHLEGRIVPLPSRYFSRLDRNGRFKIENVPAGKWTLRVWYRDGWASFPGRAIDVPGKDVKIDLTTDALSEKAAAAPAPEKGQ